ncbi:MAG TPA: DUF5681 domain-containing protein [Amphiplicatus sp.]|nr:DUF5681 domain-containing protein [Amphiplicatus sp.]
MTSNKKSDPNEDYEVGYDRPPRETRFKKGESGNPKGRPKGARNTSIIFDEVLSSMVDYRENGRHRKAEGREVLARQAFAKAAKGDLKAMAFMMKHDPKNAQAAIDAAAQNENGAQDPADIDAADKQILELFFQKARAPREDEPEDGGEQ